MNVSNLIWYGKIIQSMERNEFSMFTGDGVENNKTFLPKIFSKKTVREKHLQFSCFSPSKNKKKLFVFFCISVCIFWHSFLLILIIVLFFSFFLLPFIRFQPFKYNHINNDIYIRILTCLYPYKRHCQRIPSYPPSVCNLFFNFLFLFFCDSQPNDMVFKYHCCGAYGINSSQW